MSGLKKMKDLMEAPVEVEDLEVDQDQEEDPEDLQHILQWERRDQKVDQVEDLPLQPKKADLEKPLDLSQEDDKYFRTKENYQGYLLLIVAFWVLWYNYVALEINTLN